MAIYENPSLEGSVRVTGSLAVSQSSVDFSQASEVLGVVSSSYALTASFALNGGGGGTGAGFPFTGSAEISGSLAINNYTLPIVDGLNNQVIFTDGSGSATFGNLSDILDTFQSSSKSDTFSSVSTYTVVHNLGSEEIIVQVYDDSNIQFIPDEIEIVDQNTVLVTLGATLSGKVVITKGGHLIAGTLSVADSNALNGQSGSFYRNFNNLTNLPTLFSGSEQVSFNTISNKPALVSGSSQISSLIPGLVSGSSQIYLQSASGFTPVNKGGTGATNASNALINLGITATAGELNRLDGISTSTGELNFVDGVTSAIQEQLDGKQSTLITGSGIIISASVISSTGDSTELNSFTSSIQSEVNSLQAVTSSYILTNQTSSMTVLSASYALTASHETTFELSSSHAQMADEVPFTGVSGLPILISGSSLSSPSQGNVVLTTNGVDGTTVDLGVQTSDHVQFHCIGVGVAASTVLGEIRAAGDITAYYSSDKRLKENIIPIADALGKLENIQGVEFDWIPKDGVHSHEGHDIGVIAQEIEMIAPEAVTTRDSGYKAVKYEKLVPVLIQAIKELKSRVIELENNKLS